MTKEMKQAIIALIIITAWAFCTQVLIKGNVAPEFSDTL